MTTLYGKYLAFSNKDENMLAVGIIRKSDGKVVHRINFDTLNSDSTDDELFNGYVRYMTSKGEAVFQQYIEDDMVTVTLWSH